MLWVFALIGMLVAGSAVSIIVSSEQEAEEKLGTIPVLEFTGCKVSSISKTATTALEISANDWEIKYFMKYKKDGVDFVTSEKTIFVKSNTEAVVKVAVEKPCEQDWAEIQAGNEVIDKVLIVPKTNPVLNQVYDVVKKVWVTEEIVI